VRHACRSKAPRTRKALAFHEAPAELVLAAFEQLHGTRLGESAHMSSEEATGVSEATGSMVHEGRKRPRVNYAPVAEAGVAP